MAYKNYEQGLEYGREYYRRNRDKVLARTAKRYREKREEVLARAKVRRPEITEWERAKYQTDPAFRAKRLAKNRARQWNIVPEELEAFTDLYTQECFYCGREGGTVDHLMPRSCGGSDRLCNLVPSCKSCNSSTGNRTPGEWYDGLAIRRSEATR